MLEYWVQEGHKRGIEVHAWVNPYRWADISGEHYKGEVPNQWANYYTNCQEDVNVKDWMITSRYIKDGKTYTHFVFDPSDIKTKSRIRNVCIVLAGNYDIDGIVFDDYFYPEGLSSDSSADDWSNYQSYRNNGGSMSLADWRRNNVNEMIEMANYWIHKVKPYLRFGVSPAGAAYGGLKDSDGLPSMYNYSYDGLTCKPPENQYNGIYSDPLAWLRNKTMDYISPQLYWPNSHTTNPFGPMIDWYSKAAEKFGRHIYASQTLELGLIPINDTGYAELVRQLNQTRNTNRDKAPGEIMYSSYRMFNGFDTYVKQNAYQYPASVPAMTWYNAPDLGKVTNVKLSGTTLS